MVKTPQVDALPGMTPLGIKPQPHVSLQFIENSLYNGELWAAMYSRGRFWKLRRNGKTQTWKTRAGEYRIPVKAGLRACGAVTHSSRVRLVSDPDWRAADFVISPSDPNAIKS